MSNHARILTPLLVLLPLLLQLLSVTTLCTAAAHHSNNNHNNNYGDHLNKFLSRTRHTSSTGSALMAGASKVDSTQPIGAPLAGYNHGARRVPKWPIPHFGKYTTFMMPSTGVKAPLYTKCLSLLDTDTASTLILVTIDSIGSDNTLLRMAYDRVVNATRKKGIDFSVPFDNVIMAASHTHSGPGAISPNLLWSLAPATDLLVPGLQDQMANHVASCMLEAYETMEPVVVGVGSSELKGVTENRRVGVSPFVTPETIDPQLGIIRVDSAATGAPIATVWNFAIHGTCYGSSNMEFSGDIMGRANQLIEEQIPGSVALFVNSDTGDIAPTANSCHGGPDFYGSHIIADAVQHARSQVPTTSKTIGLTVHSEVIDFGKTNLNLTLARVANCTHGGILNICSICHYLNCAANIHLGSQWIETTPRFTSVRMNIDGRNIVMVTSPGESLVQLGNEVKSDAREMGADLTMVFGFANAHMGYFATAREYDVGGYESTLTLWGIATADKVRAASSTVMKKVLLNYDAATKH